MHEGGARLSALKAKFEKLGARVFGISPDGVKSHARFRDKHALGVTLLSDEPKAVIEAYGAWTQKNMYGRAYMGVEHPTFLIGPDGKIAASLARRQGHGPCRAGAGCLEKAAMTAPRFGLPWPGEFFRITAANGRQGEKCPVQVA